MVRQFSVSPARRARVPFFLGLAGPSGSGKTFSAHRVADGIQRIIPGPKIGIDTESGRMLHYAHTAKCPPGCKDPSHFVFQHVPFAAPFAPLDYLAAIKFAESMRPSSIIIDSASHMHEGPGGMLEQHTTNLDRWCGKEPKPGEEEWQFEKRRDKNNMRAWIQPKADLGKFVQTLIQLPLNIIFCFRAKHKIKPGGGAPEDLGLSAIADDSLIYEMTAQALLHPGARGVPDWTGTGGANAKLQTKLPDQFLSIANKKKPLDESDGELFARWALGDAEPEPARASSSPVADVVQEIEAAATMGDVAAVATRNRTRTDFSDADREAIRVAIQKRKGELQP